MLGAAYRMVQPADFAAAIRGGDRKGSARLVVHANTDGGTNSPLVGFVVPKKVAPKAVDRNRIKRQLRHLMRPQIANLKPGTLIVVRALSEANAATFTQLEADLNSCLKRLGIEVAS